MTRGRPKKGEGKKSRSDNKLSSDAQIGLVGHQYACCVRRDGQGCDGIVKHQTCENIISDENKMECSIGLSLVINLKKEETRKAKKEVYGCGERGHG